MPQPKGVDAQALSIELVQKAFDLLGESRLAVDAQLDVGKPDSLKAYKDFQQVLLMAYNEGRRSAMETHSLS